MFTVDKIYKYAETGTVADFGVGLTDINGGKKWERIAPDIVIAENGLFQRYDSVSSIGHHLMNITCPIGLDHLDWLPEGKKTIDQIIIEKTSNIMSDNIIISKQSDNQILNKIKKN